METTYPVISQTYTPDESSRTSTTREILPATAKYQQIDLYIPPQQEYGYLLNFKKGEEFAGRVVHRRYKTPPADRSYLDTRAYHNNSMILQSYTQNEMSIYSSQNVKTLSLYIANTIYRNNFAFGALYFKLDGQQTTFYVGLSKKTGEGYIILPNDTSDISSTDGSMYYNSSTGKLRARTNGSWKDVV